MQLPSGKSVTDEYLKDLAHSMVTEYASYGFEDWHEVVHTCGHTIAEDGIGDVGPIEDEKDQDAILEAVEPIAKAFASELETEFRRLYTVHLESKTW